MFPDKCQQFREGKTKLNYTMGRNEPAVSNSVLNTGLKITFGALMQFKGNRGHLSGTMGLED